MPDNQPSISASFSSDDHHWMQLALDLARRGLGHVEPNPLVGCCLVRDGKLIESGYHAKFGQAHAERAAVLAALQAGKAEQLRGSTAYVTLEPCCHHGKTPPCTDLLIEVGVSRVVIGMQDPFAAVQGKGIQQLLAAGIQVEIGLEHSAAQSLNAAYLKRLSHGKPWVIAKWAMSLDGRIASSKGHSQWISCEASRERVHLLRSRVDAIIVGSRTAKTDDPMLTARPKDSQPARTPLRVVIDSAASVALESKLVQSAQLYPTLIWASHAASSPRAVHALEQAGCRVHLSHGENYAVRLDQLLRFLTSEYSATNVLVEGGGTLLGSLFDYRQVDQCEVFIAPKIIGGHSAVSPIGGIGFGRVDEGPSCYDVNWQPCGSDIHYSCRLKWR